MKNSFYFKEYKKLCSPHIHAPQCVDHCPGQIECLSGWAHQHAPVTSRTHKRNNLICFGCYWKTISFLKYTNLCSPRIHFVVCADGKMECKNVEWKNVESKLQWQSGIKMNAIRRVIYICIAASSARKVHTSDSYLVRHMRCRFVTKRTSGKRIYRVGRRFLK